MYPQTSTRSDSNRLHLSLANSHFPQPENPEVISTVANKGAAAGVISCFHRNRPRSAIPWRRATSEKRESGRIASRSICRLSLRQTSDDDLARRWGDGARSRQVMTKPMTKAAAPIARRRLWLGLELRSPTAERVERNPASLAILTLIELAWYPGLMVRAPESLAITLANWRHLVLHLKSYRRDVRTVRKQACKKCRIRPKVRQILADALDAVQTFRGECCFSGRPGDGH